MLCVVLDLLSSSLGYAPVVGCCEHGNEPFGSLEGKGFLEIVSDCLLSKEDSRVLLRGVCNCDAWQVV
jgi:hypothetical protein